MPRALPESDVLAALPASGNTNSTVVVNIPAGTATWTSQLTYTIPAAITSLTIQGATTTNCTGTPGTSSYACIPTDSTVIQDNIAGNFGVLQINGSSGTNPLIRVTGITMQGGTGSVKYQGLLLFYSNNAGSQLRIDHNHFNLTTGGTTGWAGRLNGCFTGVGDHNIFDNASPTDTSSVVQGFMNSNTCNDSLGYGDGSWAYPTGFGTSNFFFWENNIINGGLEGDAIGGGKFVSRYNTINSCSHSSSWIHNHGTAQNGGRVRGTRAFEAYHDYLNSCDSGSALIGDAGGTGLVWGNTLSRTAMVFLAVGDERNDGEHPQTATPNGWGACGTAAGGPSNWDGNGPSCLDGIGRGQGLQSLNGANFPNALNSTTGTIAWPEEYLEPVYAWMNSLAGTTPYSIASPSTVIDRDIYVDNASFDGTTGTGYGPLASRPSTCTAGPGGTYGTSPTGSYGVAYFATDANGGNGELYVCTATNTWTGIYQPYTYPHPLVSGSSSTGTAAAPPAPTNLVSTAY